jgi:hypothetical protein
MPRRPFPVIPRGPRRKRVVRETLLLACPRVAPDWELGALRALMKPQMRGAIAHKPAGQAWPGNAAKRVERTRADVRERLGFDVDVRLAAAGDYFFTAEVPRAACEEAKGFAVLLTKRLPGVWLVLGRTFVKDGRFFRRERGIKLNLVPATNVHLTRPIRAALRDLL